MDELHTVLALSGWHPTENCYNDIPAFALFNVDKSLIMYRHPVKFTIVIQEWKNVQKSRFRNTDWKNIPLVFLTDCAEMLDTRR